MTTTNKQGAPMKWTGLFPVGSWVRVSFPEQAVLPGTKRVVDAVIVRHRDSANPRLWTEGDTGAFSFALPYEVVWEAGAYPEWPFHRRFASHFWCERIQGRKLMSPQQVQIHIRTAVNALRFVDAIVVSDLVAYHPASYGLGPEGSWSVTHRPSGTFLATDIPQARVKWLAEKIARLPLSTSDFKEKAEAETEPLLPVIEALARLARGAPADGDKQTVVDYFASVQQS